MNESIKQKLFKILGDIEHFYNVYYKNNLKEFLKIYGEIKNETPYLEKSNLNLNLTDIFAIPQYSFDESIQIDNLDDKVSPLDVTLKSQYERAFNADFSDVRIHTGELAEQITRKSNAEAVTIGEDIFFAGEKWTPGTEESEALSVHELQHIKQSQENRRFIYLEDIWEVEKEAGMVENKMKNLRLHDIQSPILDIGDIDVRNEIIPKQEIKSETPAESMESGNELQFEIYFSNSNKKYLVNAEEKQKAIELAIEKLKHDINDEINFMTENNRENYLLKLMNCIL